jgi:CelD/BcsL family acetyltransferase involved in cellulose biosynthesis
MVARIWRQGVKVVPVAPSELGDAELHLWNAHVGTDPQMASPFLSPAFSRIVGEHRSASRVAVLEEGARIVGFLPYERDREQVGVPLGVTMSDVQALIAAPELDCDLTEVVRKLRMREWRFDHLLPGRRATSPYERSHHSSPIVDLAAGREAYEAVIRERSANAIKQRDRRARQLERNVGPLRFEWDERDPALLDLLVEWKSRQYRRTEVHDLFAEPWARAVLHDIHERGDPECTGVLSTLRAGDVVVAIHFGVTRGSILHYWFPAYDVDFAKLSPGLVHLHCMLARSPEHGITLVDLGRGDQDYKRRVATGEYLVAEGRIPVRGRAYRAALLARHPGWLVRRVRALSHHTPS